MIRYPAPSQIADGAPLECTGIRDERDVPVFRDCKRHLGPGKRAQRINRERCGSHGSPHLCEIHRVCSGRRGAIKTLILDSRVVVGVGNIYANEALFAAGIHPARESGRASRARCGRLATAIKQVLDAALAEGGTTLRDFVREAGRPGYFALRLRVYGRVGQPCPACSEPIRQQRIGQRASFFCPRCQR